MVEQELTIADVVTCEVCQIRVGNELALAASYKINYSDWDGEYFSCGIHLAFMVKRYPNNVAMVTYLGAAGKLVRTGRL